MTADTDNDIENGSINGSNVPGISNTKPTHKKLEAKVRRLLKLHYGSTKHKEVKQAIDELTPHNPTSNPTKSPLLVGDFICHTLPEFPGRIKNKDKSVVQYTLGRLSFGVFQPHNLVCTIRSVRQSIRVRLESKTGVFKTYEYPVMMDLTIHTPTRDLPAVVSHDAVCYECPKQPHRMKVTFKGSTLMPSRQVLQDDELMGCWMETFEGAYEKAAKERNIIGRTLRSMMAWWFQMTFPSDEEMQQSRDKSVHFAMKRAPRGHLDVLYMSDTTRITKGNRGTLVVVEPVGCTLEEGVVLGEGEMMADTSANDATPFLTKDDDEAPALMAEDSSASMNGEEPAATAASIPAVEVEMARIQTEVEA